MVQKVKVKVEPCSIEYPPHVQKCTTPLSTPGEKVRSCERSKETVSDSEKKLEKLIPQPMRNVLGFSSSNQELQENWIVKREGNKVYAKDGSVLFECQFCRGVGLPMFFATKQDLDTHVLRLHTGQPIR